MVCFLATFSRGRHWGNMKLLGTKVWCCSIVLVSSLTGLIGCGGGSNSSTQPPPSQNPLPDVQSLSPNAMAAESSAFTLTVTGTGFVSGSSIEWNGTALTTSFVSSTQLQTQVPSAKLASAGTVSVTVSSPVPGGGRSKGINFVISAVATSVNILDVEGNDI